MTEQNPRDRLAAAVKTLDAPYAARLADANVDELLAAARALLAAPDDAEVVRLRERVKELENIIASAGKVS